MYDFHKVDDPPNANSRSMEFQNSFFLPGRRDLLKFIHRRKAVKRNKERESELLHSPPPPLPQTSLDKSSKDVATSHILLITS